MNNNLTNKELVDYCNGYLSLTENNNSIRKSNLVLTKNNSSEVIAKKLVKKIIYQVNLGSKSIKW